MRVPEQAVSERDKTPVMAGSERKGEASASKKQSGAGAALHGTKTMSNSVAARSEKKRRGEIKKRIDHLRTLLPDNVRCKNVIEVLDDTILLVNNLRTMLEGAQKQLQNRSLNASSLIQSNLIQNQSSSLLQTPSTAQLMQQQIGMGGPISFMPNAQNTLGAKTVAEHQQDLNSLINNMASMEQQQQQAQQQALSQLFSQHQQSQQGPLPVRFRNRRKQTPSSKTRKESLASTRLDSTRLSISIPDIQSFVCAVGRREYQNTFVTFPELTPPFAGDPSFFFLFFLLEISQKKGGRGALAFAQAPMSGQDPDGGNTKITEFLAENAR